jgi:hypothetical protein
MKGWLQEADLNRRPLGYEPNELPGCSILQSPDYPNPQFFSTLTARRGTAYFQGANSMSAALEPTRMPDGEIKMMSQPKQAPTLGRIVLFTPQGEQHERINGAEKYIALIGQVFSDPGNPNPYCNLYVMPPFAPAYWEGSVQEGEGGRSYNWPTRV